MALSTAAVVTAMSCYYYTPVVSVERYVDSQGEHRIGCALLETLLAWESKHYFLLSSMRCPPIWPQRGLRKLLKIFVIFKIIETFWDKLRYFEINGIFWNLCDIRLLLCILLHVKHVHVHSDLILSVILWNKLRSHCHCHFVEKGTGWVEPKGPRPLD